MATNSLNCAAVRTVGTRNFVPTFLQTTPLQARIRGLFTTV
jgi:hypothetical protein